MIKQQLPENWIVVNSKSHPDKIYYFNVKTSQSSWNQPTLEKSNKVSYKRSKLSDKQGGSSSKQQYNKMVETSKTRALQEKMSLNTKVTRKNISSSSSSNSSSSSSLTQSGTSTSVDSSSNKTQTYTPEMCALQTKIQRKSSNISNKSLSTSNSSLSSKSLNTSSTSNSDSKSKPDAKDKTQKGNTENKGRNSWNKNGKKEEKNYGLRKNLARERMQMIRKHLGLDKDKLKEIGRAVVNKTTFQKSSKTAHCNNSSFSPTYIYKNAEARLKKLRDRLTKESAYEKTITSNTVLQNHKNNNTKPGVMTSDKLIEQAKQEVLYEEMDWEPMKDEEITLEIEVARTQLCRENHERTTDCSMSENTIELMQPNGTESPEKSPIYIVVDTNVFLTNLQIIEEARDTIFKNYSCSYIVIAWTVICELDYLKDSKRKPELNVKVRKAISFIHEQFSSKHPRVIGQTREQAAKNKEKFALTCPDDDILQCCLQIQKLQKHVVLLSYDKNLCTKAMLHNIMIIERKDTLEKIDSVVKTGNGTSQSSGVINNNPDSSLFSKELCLADNIFVNIKAVIKDFVSMIVSKQMSMIYGEAEWQTYVIIKPPWTVITALKCAIKHWIAAVSEAFQRRAELCLKELLQAFEHAPDGGRKLENVEYILEKCNDFVQLADTDKYGDLITETINAIMTLKEKCQNYVVDINKKKIHDKIGFTENIQEQEVRATKTFQCFEYIYSYTCDLCGLACSIVGMPCMINFKPMDPVLSKTDVENIRPEITRKVIDLTQNLNKLLVEAEKSVKYETLVNLQQNLNTFLPDNEETRMEFDVELLDIYCCLKLKKDILKNGLRQLQDLSDHFCALASRT